MEPITIKVDFEVYNQNTDETYDCKSQDVEVEEYYIKSVARVMNNNGGFAPELSICQELDEYIFKECSQYYDRFFAPEDDDKFWDKYLIRYSEEVPEPILHAAEKYVTRKEVDVTYYYIVDGQEKSGMVTCDLQPVTFWAMMEAAKKDHQGKTDFNFLKSVNAEAYESARQSVAAKVGNEMTDFTLKEFPYKVLELAMLDAEPKEELIAEQEPVVDEMPRQESAVEEVILDEVLTPVIGRWKHAMESLHVATSLDWNNKPMPEEKHYVIRVEIPLSPVAIEKIRHGHLPQQMEDKWFMFFENDVIRYFRSWSGENVFNAYCEQRTDGYYIVKIEVNTDTYCTRIENARKDLEQLLYLLSRQCNVSIDPQCSIVRPEGEHSAKERYYDFVKQSRSESTARAYVSTLDNPVRHFINKYIDTLADSIYSYVHSNDVRSCIDRLNAIPEFVSTNEHKHNSMSAALQQYLKFVEQK